MNSFHRINFLRHVFKTSKISFTLHRNYAHSQIRPRVRFAPSPTGYLHLGGFRTAFYNYLFAKKYNGVFILRIEDTDSSRAVEGAALELENNLNWLFIQPDESPKKGGPYGPYFQSERHEMYDKYSKVLLQNGTAYKCFCSKERLSSLREKKLPYDNRCRNLSSEEISSLENSNSPFCIRLKMGSEVIVLNDLVFGKIEWKHLESEGDAVLVKTDGIPTYHFANVVDDHLMKVSHVFRGSEWLSSVPKHLYLYKCFGWEPPLFGHLPNMINPDGTKLSKRQNDLHIRQLNEEGYSPEVILNIVKLSGGGFERIDYDELNTIEELISRFEPERILKNPSTLNFSLLNDFGRLYLKKQMSRSESFKSLSKQLENIITQHFGDRLCIIPADDYYKNIITWGLDRINKLKDFTSPKFHFIWVHPEVAKSDIEDFNFDARMVLADLANSLQIIQPQNYTKKTINEALKEVQTKHNLKTNKLMKLIRLVVCGLKEGPPVAESFELVGKNNVIHRLHASASIQ